MYRRVAQRLTLRTAIALTISIGLLPAPGLSLLISGAAQASNQAERKGKPRPGKPEGVWPDLDVKNEPSVERKVPPPIPSTIPSRRNSGKPWDGRRVGDPNGTERGSAGSDLASNNNRILERRKSQTRPLMDAPSHLTYD